jgi:hypothetical protein
LAPDCDIDDRLAGFSSGTQYALTIGTGITAGAFVATASTIIGVSEKINTHARTIGLARGTGTRTVGTGGIGGTFIAAFTAVIGIGL